MEQAPNIESQFKMPEEPNIHSAEELIASLETKDELSSEELTEVTEKIKDLRELQEEGFDSENIKTALIRLTAIGDSASNTIH